MKDEARVGWASLLLLVLRHRGRLTEGRPVSGFGKAKARLDERIEEMRRLDGLEPMPLWTLHDLRRTMVTVMNEKLGFAPHVVEAVVNHMSGLAKVGVAGVYNRALYFDERRRALQNWADYVNGLCDPSSP